MYASEPVVADLNQDGSPEVVFSTYGAPNQLDSGYLVVLGADGTPLHDIPFRSWEERKRQRRPAAPTVGDLDGDGQLEILVQTFDHGMDVFTVPGSGCNCLPWPTARGGPLRMGQPSSTACRRLHDLKDIRKSGQDPDGMRDQSVQPARYSRWRKGFASARFTILPLPASYSIG